MFIGIIWAIVWGACCLLIRFGLLKAKLAVGIYLILAFWPLYFFCLLATGIQLMVTSIMEFEL